MLRVAFILLSFTLSSLAQQVAGANIVPTPEPVSSSPPTVTTGKAPVPIRKGILIGALDATGSPVTDLSKDQLQITDGGHEATPLMVRKAGELPLDLGVVLYADPATFSRQQAAVIEIVRKLIRPDKDHAFVLTAGGTKAWSDPNIKWEGDPEVLVKAIQSLDKNTGFGDPFGFDFDRHSSGMSREVIQHFGPKDGNDAPSVFGVLFEMLKSDRRPVRKAVVIVRDAWSHSPGFSGRYSPVVDGYLNQVIQSAQIIGVPFYVIGIEDQSIGVATTNIGVTTVGNHPGEAASLRSFDEQMEKARRIAYGGGRTNVERLAGSTGGHAWWSVKKNFSDVTNEIVRDIAGQYVLIFSPAGVDAANPRALKIVTTHKDCRLETPTAFYLGAQ